MGTAIHNITAYNPKANGMVKRFHRTLKVALMSRCSNSRSSHSCTGSSSVLALLVPRSRASMSPLQGWSLRPSCCTRGILPLYPYGQHQPPQKHRREVRPVSTGIQDAGSPIRPQRSSFRQVRLRTDAHTPPLTPPYSGPYELIQRKIKLIYVA